MSLHLCRKDNPTLFRHHSGKINRENWRHPHSLGHLMSLLSLQPTLDHVLFQVPPGNLDPGREPDLAETLGVLEELLERVGAKAAAMKGCAAPKKSRTIIPALTCSVFCESE